MSGRIRELDGVRGLAILMVLVWHFFSGHGHEYAEGSLLSFLQIPASVFWSGVDLFFVLSGFLIGGIILDNHHKPNFLKTFWVRRCCRILPVLFLLLLVCYGSAQLLDRERFAWLYSDLMPGWSYPTFTQNLFMGARGTMGGNFLGITWSLAVEEQFYLFAPLLMVLIGRRFWLKAVIPLILLAFALRLAFSGWHTIVITVFRMDALLAGVLVAAAFRDPFIKSAMERYREVLLTGFIVLLMISGALIISDGFGVFKFTWFAFLYAWFLTVVLLYRETRVTGMLRLPALCFWGGIAYGLYMYHQGISGWLHGWLRAGAEPAFDDRLSMSVTLLAFLSATVAAWISFRFFELPFLRLGKKTSYGTVPELEQRNPAGSRIAEPGV